MTPTRRLGAPLLGLAAVLALASMSRSAPTPPQDPPPASKPAPARKAIDPSRRVPPYFGQIGLSDDQKESVYKVRARHLEKINALRKQLDEANAALLAECESLLTDAQRTLLTRRRDEARAKAAAKKAEASRPAEAGKPAAPTSPSAKAAG